MTPPIFETRYPSSVLTLSSLTGIDINTDGPSSNLVQVTTPLPIILLSLRMRNWHQEIQAQPCPIQSYFWQLFGAYQFNARHSDSVPNLYSLSNVDISTGGTNYDIMCQ